MNIYEYLGVLGLVIFIVVMFLFICKLFYDLERDDDKNEV